MPSKKNLPLTAILTAGYSRKATTINALNEKGMEKNTKTERDDCACYSMQRNAEEKRARTEIARV